MSNKEIAETLNETAALMEIAGMDGFRIRSYRNAAVVIESLTESVEEVIRADDRDVTKIKGIGKGIASALTELVARGSFARRDELLEKYPPTALELLKISGLGPKSIALLYDAYRVSTIDALEQLCRDGKLRTLPRMGEKLEQKILRGIENYKRSAGRFLLDSVDHVATELVAYLSEVDGVDRITPAGSLRRGKETIGDLDLLVTGPHATAALDRFVKFEDVREVLGHGETKASARIGASGLQVDVRAVESPSYGAAMMYFTGSKEHNVAIRDRAVRMGCASTSTGCSVPRMRSLSPPQRRKKSTKNWGCRGSPPSCVRTPARSKPRLGGACRASWSLLIFIAMSICTPTRRTAITRSPRWRKPR